MNVVYIERARAKYKLMALINPRDSFDKVVNVAFLKYKTAPEFKNHWKIYPTNELPYRFYNHKDLMGALVHIYLFESPKLHPLIERIKSRLQGIMIDGNPIYFFESKEAYQKAMLLL